MQYYVVISPTIEEEPFQMGSNGSSLLILMIFLLFNIEEHNILRLNITLQACSFSYVLITIRVCGRQ